MHRELDRSRRDAQADPENKQSLLSHLYARSRLEGSEVFLEVLRDREQWNQAPQELQDGAVHEVVRRLGSDYELKETRLYACQGQAHRIATITHKPSAVDFQLIPGGIFLRGSMEQSWEQPIQKLRVPPFLLGRYPMLTYQGQAFTETMDPDLVRLPRGRVTWFEAKESLELLDPPITLPSETFWEYACRSGTSSAYYWGETMNSDSCWHDLNATTRKPVDLHESQCNAFGLVDMLGNVSEWCADDFENGYFDHDSFSPRILKESQGKVGRGGCYNDNEDYARCAARYVIPPERRGENIGYRAFRRI